MVGELFYPSLSVANVMVIGYFLYLVTLFLVMVGVCSNIVIIDAMLMAKSIYVCSLLVKGLIMLWGRICSERVHNAHHIPVFIFL